MQCSRVDAAVGVHAVEQQRIASSRLVSEVAAFTRGEAVIIVKL
jgi:hypothetical protein